MFSLCSGCLCVKLLGRCLYPFCIPILFPLRPCFAFCLWFLPCLPHSRTYQIKINLHLAEVTAVVTSAVSRRSSCFSTKDAYIHVQPPAGCTQAVQVFGPCIGIILLTQSFMLPLLSLSVGPFAKSNVMAALV